MIVPKVEGDSEVPGVLRQDLTNLIAGNTPPGAGEELESENLEGISKPICYIHICYRFPDSSSSPAKMSFTCCFCINTATNIIMTPPRLSFLTFIQDESVS